MIKLLVILFLTIFVDMTYKPLFLIRIKETLKTIIIRIVIATVITTKSKRVYQQLNEKDESSEKIDTDESRRFWGNIWGTEKIHNKDTK